MCACECVCVSNYYKKTWAKKHVGPLEQFVLMTLLHHSPFDFVKINYGQFEKCPTITVDAQVSDFHFAHLILLLLFSNFVKIPPYKWSSSSLPSPQRPPTQLLSYFFIFEPALSSSGDKLSALHNALDHHHRNHNHWNNKKIIKFTTQTQTHVQIF